MTAPRAARKKPLRSPRATRIALSDLFGSTLAVLKRYWLGIFLLAMPFAIATVWLEQWIVSRHPVAKPDARLFAILSVYGTCVIGYLADATISVFVFRNQQGHGGPQRKFFQFNWRNLVSVILVASLAPLGTLAGLAVAIFPGVILWLSWLFAAPAAAIEGIGPLEAFRRSARLTWGSRRTLFYAFALAYIGAELLLTATAVAMGQPALAMLQDPKPLSPLEMAFTILIDALQIGFCGVLCCVAYLRLLPEAPSKIPSFLCNPNDRTAQEKLGTPPSGSS